ncbi:MAG: SDR family oxidoreductase [Rhodospirillales bacterium]|jgi:NAD(P)-dependent dehydrogenase (short-subunit alcohol dehydrogenase family)|nr:SDR family oxidoreductase [Rhodospirillales bacterium]
MNNDVPRTALITGAAKRIGRAMALDLAAHGWAVAVHFNSSEADAVQVCDEIVQAGGRAAPVRADLEREDDCQALVKRATAALGPLTLLINNASIFEKDSPETATRESWDAHMQINLRAPFVLVQEFSATLPKDITGHVINIVDQRVWNLTGSFTSYTVSKAALWTLTRTLALALAPRIRVNAVGPGPTLPSARQTDEQFQRQWQAVPLARQVFTDEICDAVRFIIDAHSMTGQMIALDGGQHLGWAPPARAQSLDE